MTSSSLPRDPNASRERPDQRAGTRRNEVLKTAVLKTADGPSACEVPAGANRQRCSL